LDVSLYNGNTFFIFVENAFCIFFVFELIVRFGAFKRKKSCCTDMWFMFDLMLGLLMVGETWVLPFILWVSDNHQPGRGAWSVLRVARMLKLARLGRMARLLRIFPEVVTLAKGIKLAVRSVFFTSLILAVMVIVFGIIFKIQSEGNEDMEMFGTLSSSMWVLLIEGVLLDGPKDTLDVLSAKHKIMTGIFICFIMLANFTILNMLIGILCNVVDNVAQAEKAEADVAYLKNTLLDLLECHDEDNNGLVRKSEFDQLMRNPEMHLILTRFGVDVNDLLSLKESLFDDKDAAVFGNGLEPDEWEPHVRQLAFSEFLKVVLRLRGNNSASVTDIVELREYIQQCLDKQTKRMERRISKFERTVRDGQDASVGADSKDAIPDVSGHFDALAESQDVGKLSDDVVPKLRENSSGAVHTLAEVVTRLDKMASEQREALSMQERLHWEFEKRYSAKQDALVAKQVELGEQVQDVQAKVQKLCDMLMVP